MKKENFLDIKSEVVAELNMWRNQVINILISITALAFSPAIVIWIIQFSRNPAGWQVSLFYLIIYVWVVGLAFSRGLDYRVKAWSIVLLCYATGVMALVLGGLAGDGRVYLMTVPILALILVGAPAGLTMAGLSLLTYAAISITAYMSWMTDFLIIKDNPLDLSIWLQEGLVVAACLALIMVLQWRFSKLLVTIASEKVSLFGVAQESEERYRSISELTSDLAYAMRIDLDGSAELEWVTDALTRTTSFTIDDLNTQDGWQRLIHPDDMPIAHKIMQSILSGQTDISNLHILTKNGEKRWVRHHARPVWDEAEDRVVRIFGAVQDITERRQAEESRDEALRRYRIIADFTYDWEYWGMPDGYLSYVSPSCKRITGFDAGQFIKNPDLLAEIIVPEDQEIWLKHQQESFQKKAVDKVQFRIRRKNGETCWIEHVCQPVIDENSTFLGFRGSNRDITKRKQAEEELHLQFELTRAISGTPGFHAAIELVLRRVGVATKWDYGEAWIPSDDGSTLECAPVWYSSNPKKVAKFRQVSEEVTFQPNIGLPGRVLSSRQPEWIPDITATPEEIFLRASIAAKTDLRAAFGVPITAGQDVLAVLVYYLSEACVEDNRMIDLVSSVATQLGEVMRRKQAEEALQRHNEELTRLYRASETLLPGEAPNIERLAQTIVEVALREFEHTNCSLLIIDESAAQPKICRIAVAGPYTDEVSKGKLNLDGEGIVPKAIRSNQLLNVPDVTREPNYLTHWIDARSELAIPLSVGDKVIGAIDVQSVEVDAYSADDERLMSIFAERAALALENARLYERTHQQLLRLSALRNIDNSIIGTLNLQLTLKILLEAVTKHLGVDAADVLTFNAHLQTLEYGAGIGFRTAALKHTNLRLGKGYAGKAALERRMVHIDNMLDLKNGLQKAPLLPEENFITYFGVPLIAKGKIKGVLEIFHRSMLEASSEWLGFLETLAGQAAIAIDNATLFDGLQRANLDLILAYDTTLEGWARALELRDMETEGHSRRVTDMTMRLAQAMGMNRDDLVHVRRGALLHDIGKMGVPDYILHKPGPLTEEEWVIMRQHPVYAYQFLSKIEYLQPALAIPYSHHEKWDGTGYPRGLKAEQIPLPARIFAVIDVWDALTSDRPYRPAWSKDDALTHIRAQSGKHFAPKVVEVFMELCLDQLGAEHFPGAT